MIKAYINSIAAGYLPAIRAGFEWIGLGGRLRPGDRVYLKPNLTFPEFRPGVMTHPECIEALVIALKDYDCRISVVESDSGGYNRFSIDEVFEKIGLKEMAKRYGFQAINLSHVPSREVPVPNAAGVRVSVPVMLMDESDLMITVPVPKVHSNAVISVAVKNQWGCIPATESRLRLHPHFPAVIHAVNEAIRTAVAVVDGRFGLTRNGPMRGDPVALNWLMVCDNIYATDLSCCQIMQIAPRKVPLLRYLQSVHALPAAEDVCWNQDWRPFARFRFHLDRDLTDYPGLMAFRSAACAYWAYRSPLAGLLHKMLYLVREPFY